MLRAFRRLFPARFRRLVDRPGWPLVVLWLAAQAWALRHGPTVLYDSVRYLQHATLLAQGRGAEATAHWGRYIGYAFYLSLFLRAGLSVWGAVLGQVCLSGVAAAAYFSTIRRLAATTLSTGSATRTAALATALMLGWTDLQRFSAHILTESLFTSSVLLAAWALAWAAYARRPHPARWLVVLLALAAATLARPNGFLVLLAAGVAGGWWQWQQVRATGRVAATLAAIGAVVASWPLLNAASRTYHLVKTYAGGQVISGYNGWLVRPTAPLAIPSADLPQLQRIAAFAAAQPGYFLRLAGAKVLAFVGYIKPFWSAGHLVVAALVLWPTWVLAARGMRSRRVPAGARWFAGALLAGQAGVVALTVEDWDARFLTPLLPLVFGLAAFGLADYRLTRRALFPADPASARQQQHEHDGGNQ